MKKALKNLMMNLKTEREGESNSDCNIVSLYAIFRTTRKTTRAATKASHKAKRGGPNGQNIRAGSLVM